MNEKKTSKEKWIADDLEFGEAYAGEFIAVLGKKIIAHGKDELEVMKAADRCSKDYVIAYLYSAEEMIV